LLGHKIVQSSGPDFRRAILRASDDVLCSKKGSGALFNFELSFGSTDLLDRPFQIAVIHTTFVTLRKQLVSRIERGLQEAIAQQFPSLKKEGDSIVVSPLHSEIFKVIASMLSVILTGQDLGRNPELEPAMRELTGVINEITFKSKGKPKFMVDRRRLKELTSIIHKYVERRWRSVGKKTFKSPILFSS